MKPYLFTKKSIFRMFSALLVMISMLAQVTPARAATITVINTNNSGAGSLRQAIIDAAVSDTIIFGPGLAGQTITLDSTELILTKNVTIDGSLLGANPVTLTGSFIRVFTVNAGVTATLTNLTIANSQVSGPGGGISNAGTLTVTNSTLSGNKAITINGNGGAIANTGTLMVTNSTLSGNVSTGLGGGIYNSGAGTLYVTNSTLSGNIANGSGGGGIYNAGAALTVKNSTLSGNSSASWGGGISHNAGTFFYANTIITNSTNYDCYNGSGVLIPAINNVKNLVINNATGSNSCGTPAFTADPLLGPLGPNGGPTHTMALPANSPAVNTGDATTCNAIAGVAPVNKLDQRGSARPATLCDIGAYEAVLFTLTVNKTGSTGLGTVTSSPAGIDCGATCAAPYISGTAVTLTASAAVGSTFIGWTVTGVPAATCSGTSTCTVTMDVARTVTAVFMLSAPLAINKTGTGTGVVTSSPAGINCGATCQYAFALSTVVTLTASPDSGSVFSGWSGEGCSGTGTCVVTMNTFKLVTANFTSSAVPTYTMTIVKTGTGTGTITSSPTGIDCGAACSSAFTSGTVVVLTAVPDAGSSFNGWSGAGCSGTGTCTVTMSAVQAVAATFNTSSSSTNTLTVTKTGSGTGTVTSSPVGIDCGATCSFAFNSGTVVTLTAVPDAGFPFGGWSGGGCSGTGTCVVTMSAAQSVIATFGTATTNTLTIVKTGTGTGKVTSAPVGIDCGSVCSFPFTIGAAVTLTAVPDAGFPFGGWSGGGCSGTALTCIVTMSSAQSVTATFGAASGTNTLTVVKTGTGTGKVTSSPVGIDCGATCSFAYTSGAAVTLTAVPDAGVTFGGWSGGGCSGTALTCVVTMSAAKTVIATFGTSTTNNLTVTKAGTGSGTVTSAPVGIACGDVCLYPFTIGASVTLTAVPAVGSNFTGWNGAGCSGTATTCVVTMSAARMVNATFGVPNTNILSVSKIGTGTGKVTSAPVGIDCGSTCLYSFAIGASVTLTAVPDAGIPFVGWSGGGCSGTGTCVVTMSSAQSVFATFGTATTFTDVATTYWAYQSIERLYDAGITLGCSTSPSKYCPLDSTTRAQMAIFILRGMYGKTYNPPTATGTVFTDVFLSTFGAAWIEQFSKEGITLGCSTSPAKYCPDDTVTRAQMAIFLLRGKYGSTYAPPVATGIFTDVPVGSFAADWIEQLYKEGITSGCGTSPLTYCPNSTVTRDQMAVFLVRTFNLP